jgi:hypothetical protein
MPYATPPSHATRFRPAAAATAPSGQIEQFQQQVQADRTTAAIVGIVWLGSIGLSAYHGYKRLGDAEGAVLYGIAGASFPVATPLVGLLQGFGKRKGGKKRK